VLGFGVQDLNYTFSGFSSTNRTETAISTYVPDAAGASRWLTPGTTAAGLLPIGTYTATTTFSLAGFNASTLSLFLDIAADNIVVAALNGTTILSCNTGGAACFSAFTFNHNIAAGGIALAGLNTLTFTVTNQNDQSPTALRVQVSGNAHSSGDSGARNVGPAGRRIGGIRTSPPQAVLGGFQGVLLTSSRE
jgi:hypothetical protein